MEINSLGNNNKNYYNILASIQYINKTTLREEISPFNIKQLVKYDISKDSTKYNYNIHMLTLTQISEIELLEIKNLDNWILIELKENGKTVSNKKFKVLVVNVLSEINQVYNIQIVMLSEIPYIFSISHKYSKVSVLNTGKVLTGTDAHSILSTVLQKIQEDSGTLINAHYNDSGKTPQFYSSIRIHESKTDIDLFNYLFKTFPPYILEPYFIFDDLHIVPDKENAPYNIIITNLFDIIGNYFPVSMKSLSKIYPSSTRFLQTVPLLNAEEVYKTLSSTIILKNGLTNRISEIKPEIPSNNNNAIINVTSNLDPRVYIERMKARKLLADNNATIETYVYSNINLTDIRFLSLYNISNAKVYDHIPLVIEYEFLKNQYNSFWNDVIVQYAKISPK